MSWNYRSNAYDSLKASYIHFLESNGFTNFIGVSGAIRGSKIITVYIYKCDKIEFEKLNGRSDGYRRYWVMPIYELEDCIKYSVSCVKK